MGDDAQGGTGNLRFIFFQAVLGVPRAASRNLWPVILFQDQLYLSGLVKA